MPHVLTTTDKEPDRLERRMPEFPVHGRMLWPVFVGVAARNNKKCRQAEHPLSGVGTEALVRPRPGWYF